ncbi:protein FAR1-RELATED SEQUENCE 2-like [Cynara cardunculus var. scolymus]|uniref:protein FAR1-RELATED SEQUENCE 2-like n=1 Tax=Cynara cardunculus var. scolymus TaxID=59895 RepID=UPI000D62752D|nr:protein FAR1-RELATED SEQUENCE 2-like [Cynara cardunculus var. scolymus]
MAIQSSERRYRNTNLKRCGCKAWIKIHLTKDRSSYEIYEFVEAHNHALFNTDEVYEFQNILNSSSYKVGAIRAHRIQTTLNGGFEHNQCSEIDFKNFKRDAVACVGEKDAKILSRVIFSSISAMIRSWEPFSGQMRLLESTTKSLVMHAMIFVPFLAVDNHKASIVVGSGLISGETIENFTWVLRAFLKCHEKQPVFVITDQCSAMKQAIPLVFTEAKHRLCMWHIMKKVHSKVSVALNQDPMFSQVINKLVWNTHIGPSEFETKWQEMIAQYNLGGDPCRNVFFDIQKEIKKAVWFCGIETVECPGDLKTFIISHKNKKSSVSTTYRVSRNYPVNTVEYECNLFTCYGYLCRHAFKFLINDEVDSIPDQYVLRRWKQNLVPVQLQSARVRYGEVDAEKDKYIIDVYSKVDDIISIARNDKALLSRLEKTLDKFLVDIEKEVSYEDPSQQKMDAIRDHLGVSIPDDVDILPPSGIRNKGCGTGKRLVSVYEKIQSASKKTRQKCATCGQRTGHDSRNCPELIE